MKCIAILSTSLLAAGLILSAFAAADAPQPAPLKVTPEATEFFEKNVRPVLAENCFGCHGPKQQFSGLRLDSRALLLKGGEKGPAIVPGNPAKSALVQAISYTGKIKMPPAGKLPEKAIQALTAWVKMGAPWPGDEAQAGPKSMAERVAEARANHWAFQPVRQPDIPKVKNQAWVQTPLDSFVLAKLEAKKLKPNPKADRHTLVRRAYFDLTGLPPTPAEVAAFVADRSPHAFDKVIERLLASPQYGERWARYWLDVARYADSKGYVFTAERRFPYSYTFRDYVVNALNTDLPYDQFILQQLAAEQLDLGGDKRPLAAMGFLTLGRRFLNNKHDIIDDRMDVTLRGLQGLTVTCARCHEHKYDPIPMEDYYSLYGVFDSSVEPDELPLIGESSDKKATEEYRRAIEKQERAVATAKEKRLTSILSSLRRKAAPYLLNAQELRGKPDAQIINVARTKALRRVALTRWRNFLDASAKANHPVMAAWHAYAALPAEQYAAKAPAVLAELQRRANDGGLNPLVAKALSEQPPASLKEVAERYQAVFAQAETAWQAVVGGESAPAALDDANLEAVRQVLYGADAPLNVTGKERDRLFNGADRRALEVLVRKLDTIKVSHPGAPMRAMVLVDREKPVEPVIFKRGNPNRRGEQVPRRLLWVLSDGERQPFKQGSGRLELAQAIASKDNPLTARVMVNRIWMHHFDRPLVSTPSDFGVRAAPPTHPAMLDYLAYYFMENGWSIKNLHRLIMKSAVYQQTSDDNPAYANIDPDNFLLWRMNRRRLEFEALRDSLLAVSGQLDRTLGGPPVIIAAAARDRGLNSASVDLSKSYYSRRRTLYAFIDRQNLPSLFRTFDFANPDSHQPRRFTTTVPQQALFMMNNEFVAEQARHLIRRREILYQKTAASRIRQLYRIVLGRSPRPAETEAGLRFLKADADQPLSPAEGKEMKTTEHLNAWEQYAQVLLLTNEFVYVD